MQIVLQRVTIKKKHWHSWINDNHNNDQNYNVNMQILISIFNVEINSEAKCEKELLSKEYIARFHRIIKKNEIEICSFSKKSY